MEQGGPIFRTRSNRNRPHQTRHHCGGYATRRGPTEVATRPTGEPDHRDPEGFWITSGASQASAIASGIITLLLEARPDLSNHDVKCILANTAAPLTAVADGEPSPFAQGRGLVDLAAALKSNATDCEERLEGLDPSLPLKGAFASQ